MGTFLAVVFVFVVIAAGINAICSKFKDSTTRNSATPHTNPDAAVVVNPALTVPTESPYKLRALLQALSNEGFMGHVRSHDDNLIYVDNPLLSMMIEAVDSEIGLTWHAPHIRLRLRPMDRHSPENIRLRYNWLLLTPTHAIGFNRPPVETSA